MKEFADAITGTEREEKILKLNKGNGQTTTCCSPGQVIGISRCELINRS